MSAPLSLLKGQGTDVPVQQYTIGPKEAIDRICKAVVGASLYGVSLCVLAGEDDVRCRANIAQYVGGSPAEISAGLTELLKRYCGALYQVCLK